MASFDQYYGNSYDGYTYDGGAYVDGLNHYDDDGTYGDSNTYESEDYNDYSTHEDDYSQPRQTEFFKGATGFVIDGGNFSSIAGNYYGRGSYEHYHDCQGRGRRRPAMPHSNTSYFQNSSNFRISNGSFVSADGDYYEPGHTGGPPGPILPSPGGDTQERASRPVRPPPNPSRRPGEERPRRQTGPPHPYDRSSPLSQQQQERSRRGYGKVPPSWSRGKDMPVAEPYNHENANIHTQPITTPSSSNLLSPEQAQNSSVLLQPSSSAQFPVSASLHSQSSPLSSDDHPHQSKSSATNTKIHSATVRLGKLSLGVSSERVSIHKASQSSFNTVPTNTSRSWRSKASPRSSRSASPATSFNSIYVEEPDGSESPNISRTSYDSSFLSPHARLSSSPGHSSLSPRAEGKQAERF